MAHGTQQPPHSIPFGYQQQQQQQQPLPGLFFNRIPFLLVRIRCAFK